MQPKLLLLDEPMAGIGREETERMVELLQRLKGQSTMILVEHDMTRGVRARRPHLGADRRPRPRTGAPAAVRADPAVVAAYLGEQME